MHNNIDLGPWFKVQGLCTLDQVADYIIKLQDANKNLIKAVNEKPINTPDVSDKELFSIIE